MRIARTLCISLTAACFGCWLPTLAARQAGQTATGGTSASGNTGGTNTGGSVNPADGTNRTRTSTGSNNAGLNRRGLSVFISGVVVLDSGSRPPNGAVIERVCGGQVTKESYANPDGSFSFMAGGDSFIAQDVSSPGRVGVMDAAGNPMPAPPNGTVLNSPNQLLGCELRAQLGGFRSSSVILNVTQTMGNFDVGTLVLYPSARVQGTTVSVTNLAAPDKARKSLERAEQAMRKKEWARAETLLNAALQTYPSYATAWFRLGQTFEIAGRNEEARNAFSKSIELDGMFIAPFIELARMAALEKRWQDTADLTARALKLNPLDFPYGYFLDAMSNYYLNRMDAAERSALMLERLDSQHRYPEVYLLLANMFRRRRDAIGEASQLRDYLKYAPRASNADEVRARLLRLEGSWPA
jgi:tetratricopeptide (TPR) repeat protein